MVFSQPHDSSSSKNQGPPPGGGTDEYGNTPDTSSGASSDARQVHEKAQLSAASAQIELGEDGCAGRHQN